MISVILSIIWWLFDLQEDDLAILKSRSLPFFVGGRMCSGLSINDLSALTNGKMDHTFYSTIGGTEQVLAAATTTEKKTPPYRWGTSCQHNRALNYLSDSTTIYAPSMLLEM